MQGLLDGGVQGSRGTLHTRVYGVPAVKQISVECSADGADLAACDRLYNVTCIRYYPAFFLSPREAWTRAWKKARGQERGILSAATVFEYFLCRFE